MLNEGTFRGKIRVTMTVKKIVLIGAPGCGKGTQADRIREHFNLTHVSSGDVLRNEVKQETDFGKQIKEYMERGEIGPVELITDVILNHVDTNCADAFLFDGFPRALYQAEELKKRHTVNAAILIDVPEEALLARITGRRTCSGCGKVYHVSASPPRREGICDACEKPLIQRKDDNEETVKKRLEVFHTQTAPVISFYEKEGILKKIDGSGEPGEVFERLLDRL